MLITIIIILLDHLILVYEIDAQERTYRWSGEGIQRGWREMGFVIGIVFVISFFFLRKTIDAFLSSEIQFMHASRY